MLSFHNLSVSLIALSLAFTSVDAFAMEEDDSAQRIGVAQNQARVIELAQAGNAPALVYCLNHLEQIDVTHRQKILGAAQKVFFRHDKSLTQRVQVFVERGDLKTASQVQADIIFADLLSDTYQRSRSNIFFSRPLLEQYFNYHDWPSKINSTAVMKYAHVLLLKRLLDRPFHEAGQETLGDDQLRQRTIRAILANNINAALDDHPEAMAWLEKSEEKEAQDAVARITHFKKLVASAQRDEGQESMTIFDMTLATGDDYHPDDVYLAARYLSNTPHVPTSVLVNVSMNNEFVRNIIMPTFMQRLSAGDEDLLAFLSQTYGMNQRAQTQLEEALEAWLQKLQMDQHPTAQVEGGHFVSIPHKISHDFLNFSNVLALADSLLDNFISLEPGKFSLTEKPGWSHFIQQVMVNPALSSLAHPLAFRIANLKIDFLGIKLEHDLQLAHLKLARALWRRSVEAKVSDFSLPVSAYFESSFGPIQELIEDWKREFLQRRAMVERATEGAKESDDD